MAFKDKTALENPARQMEAATAEIARLQRKLSDPNLYRKDPNAFRTLTDALAAQQAGLAAAEERWLELELMREELGV